MKMCRHAALSAAAVLSLAGVATADLSTDYRFFFWDAKLGDMATDSRALVRVQQNVVIGGVYTSGYDVGWAAAAEVDARNITSSDQLWLFLMGFGKGNLPGATLWDVTWAKGPSLIFDEDDELVCDPTNLVHLQRTIWNDNGKTKMRAWILELIRGYTEYQEEYPLAGVPVPGYMFLDTEVAITHWLPESDELLTMLRAMLECDPRADDDGYPIDGFPGKTLVDLYADAGNPVFDEDDPSWGTTANKLVSTWFVGIANQAREAAMQYAVYEPLISAFGCEISDYDSTVYLDGIGTGPRGGDRKWHSPCGSGGTGQPDYPHWAGAVGANIVQSPTLYGLDSPYWDSGNPYRWAATDDEAVLGHHRDYVTSCQRSFKAYGSWDPHTIVPWVTLPNFGDGGSCEVGYAFEHDPDAGTPKLDAIRHMAMMDGKGMTRWIVWFNSELADVSDHSAFKKAVDYAGIAEVSGYTVISGTDLMTYSDPELLSNAETLDIDAVPAGGGGYIAEVVVEFDTLFPSPSSSNKFNINTEMWTTPSSGQVIACQVSSWYWDPTPPTSPYYNPLTTIYPTGDMENPSIDYVEGTTEHYVDSSSKDMKVKLRFTSASDFIIHIDMVNIFRTK